MRIAVTGGSGRIGRYAVRDLVAAGHEVTSLDIAGVPEPGSRPLRVDLTDAGQVYGALAGAEAVVHMGAWANAGVVPDTRTYCDNTRGTFNLFQACADLGIKRVVSASSAQVYGLAAKPPEYVPLDEEHPCRPVNCYALSKMAGEQAAEYFAAKYGLEILSFRFMGVRRPAEIGPEIERLAADPDRGGSLLWTRTDVRDAARACRLAVEAVGVETGPYNITGAQVLVDEDAMDLVGRCFGAQTQVRGEIADRCSPMTCARAERVFGYRPQYLWSTTTRHPEEGDD